jgi:hypothetical protein
VAPGAALLVACAFAAPVRADVAILTQREVPQYAQVIEGLRAAGRDLRVVDLGDLPALEALLAHPPVVVVAVGGRAFEVARARALRSAIVAAAVLNPDRGARKDVTAVPFAARPSDTLDALLALAPDARRVVAIHSPEASALAGELKALAQRRGLELDLETAGGDPASFRWTFLGALQGHDAVWLLPDPRLASPELARFMAQACRERRIALAGFLDGMARAGALFAVAPDLDAIGREAARLAAELDARPAAERNGVPFRYAAGRLYVNDRTRSALKLGGALPGKAEVFK